MNKSLLTKPRQYLRTHRWPILFAIGLLTFCGWFLSQNGDTKSAPTVTSSPSLPSSEFKAAKVSSLTFPQIIPTGPNPIAESAPESLHPTVKSDPSRRQEYLNVAREVQRAWQDFNNRLKEAPREVWDQQAIQFRLEHQLELASVETYFGQSVPLVHPAEVDPKRPTPPISLPNNPARPGPQPNPALSAFNKDAAALASERQTLLANQSTASDSSKQNALNNWEKENAERLSTHHRAARELQQRSIDSPPAQPIPATTK